MLDGLSCGKGIKFVVWFQKEQETEEENPTQYKKELLTKQTVLVNNEFSFSGDGQVHGG